MLPDHLGGQITRHLPRSDASDPGELLAHDHGSVALGAFVDPDPAAPGPEPVARPVMHVLVREVHLISQPAFYRVTPRQARSNSSTRWRPRNPVPPRIRTSIGASFLVADRDALLWTAYDPVDDEIGRAHV